MMKQVEQLLAFGLLMCVASLTLAATNVVVFNPQAAVLNSDAAQAQLKALRESSEYAGLQARAESLQAELKALRKEEETEAVTWSEDQLAEHRSKMESVNRELESIVQRIYPQQQAFLKNIMQVMQPRLEQALREVIEETGADLVLDSQTALYTTPAADVTAKVTEKLNKAK